MTYSDVDIKSLLQVAVRLSDQATSIRLVAEIQIAVPCYELESNELSYLLRAIEDIESLAIRLEVRLMRAMREIVPIGPIQLERA